MSLFQCTNCGARENTAPVGLAGREKKQCSECLTGTWHGLFPKMLLPIGMFVTNNQGNLAHKDTGDTDLSKYAL